jgi:transcriptional regulator with XRE-family HTH domain
MMPDRRLKERHTKQQFPLKAVPSQERVKLKADLEMPQESLIDRLKHLLATRDMDAKTLSRKAGLSDGAVGDILRGKSTNPKNDTMLNIAKVLGVSVAYLLGESHNPTVQIEAGPGCGISTPELPILAIAESGRFRVVAGRTKNGVVHGPLHPPYAGYKHFGVEINDDTMNEAKPQPFVRGACVLCVSIQDARIKLENGQFIAVAKKRGSKMREVTVRRVVMRKDHIELVADGTEKRKPMSVPLDFNGDPKRDCYALGLVYASVGLVYRPK